MSFEFDFNVINNWSTGFVGEIFISNQAVNTAGGWVIEFNAPFAITNIWNAEIVSRVGDHYVIRSASWNASIPPGGTVSFGFQANSSGPVAAPTSVEVNDQPVIVDSPLPPSPVVLPKLSVSDASVVEGNSGSQTATFTVSLDKAATGSVTVAYATANGTALSGSDYTAKSGTLTFALGETSKSVTVAVAGDGLVEGDETFLFNLASPTNATLADAQGTGTIKNDDAATPPPVTGSNPLSPSVKITSDWGSGFTADVAVKNGGTTLIDDWTIKFEMPYDIVNIWNAEIVSHVGDTYVIRNASWNDKIAANGQVTFGFQATPGQANAGAIDWVM
jgi:chitinase